MASGSFEAQSRRLARPSFDPRVAGACPAAAGDTGSEAVRRSSSIPLRIREGERVMSESSGRHCSAAMTISTISYVSGRANHLRRVATCISFFTLNDGNGYTTFCEWFFHGPFQGLLGVVVTRDADEWYLVAEPLLCTPLHVRPTASHVPSKHHEVTLKASKRDYLGCSNTILAPYARCWRL